MTSRVRTRSLQYASTAACGHIWRADCASIQGFYSHDQEFRVEYCWCRSRSRGGQSLYQFACPRVLMVEALVDGTEWELKQCRPLLIRHVEAPYPSSQLEFAVPRRACPVAGGA